MNIVWIYRNKFKPERQKDEGKKRYICINYLFIYLYVCIYLYRNSSDNTDIGLDYKQGIVREEAKLSVLREKMIKDMESRGVNPKYLGEMKNVDIRKLLVR